MTFFSEESLKKHVWDFLTKATIVIDKLILVFSVMICYFEKPSCSFVPKFLLLNEKDLIQKFKNLNYLKLAKYLQENFITSNQVLLFP